MSEGEPMSPSIIVRGPMWHLDEELMSMVSVQRGGERAWVGGNLTSMSSAVSGLGYSGWLLHCHKILTSAVWIASRIALEGASVLVHCRYVLCSPSIIIKLVKHFSVYITLEGKILSG